jgi:hypothetical protein
MAKVGLQKAAELTGKTTTTIRRAMTSGRLSFELDETGEKVVDTSELERVYGALGTRNKNDTEAYIKAELQRAQDMLEVERMKMRVKNLEDQLHLTKEQLDDMKEQRDLWQKQAQQILITNQMAQKQADDLKEELREREAHERAMRQRQLEERLRRQAENENFRMQQQQQAEMDRYSTDTLWKKIVNRIRAA